jgi:endonuclease YncB( thermonuclease family)
MTLRWLRSKSRSLALASMVLALPLGGANAECRLSDDGAARAAGIPDGRTLLLQDGREILLTGIEPAPAWPGAQAELARRVEGQALTLKGLSSRPDRHGRLAAFVSVSGSETPVQYDLLREGFVRAAGPVEVPGCRADLLSEERKARTAKVGLWSDPGYDIRRADDPAAVEAGRGHFAQGLFAIVEGKVLSVRESGGTIYVNFGQKWSEDFTATIPKRLEGRFTSANLTPRALSGRMVRIRGVIEERGGPWIEVTRPDQIEFAEIKR